MNKKPTLAEEFVEIYKRFIFDGKDHLKALDLTEIEFRYKLAHDYTLPPIFFFIDNSRCVYKEHEWIISHQS